MKRLLILTALATLLLAAAPVSAAGPIYVDDDDLCEGKSPCYTHPQDAVNAAAPGDRIIVYPGTYGSRKVTCDWAPSCTENDSWAPTLIVYKDNLSITAADKNPAKTIIEATHGYWSNPEAVAKSTAGGVVPMFGSEPNAIGIIADGVTISGFTIRRPSDPTAGGHSNVLIGGLYLGYGGVGETLGFDGNVVTGNVLDGGTAESRGLSIWHSSGNQVTSNLIVDPNQNAIQIYDGETREQVKLPSPSRDNLIEGNTITDNSATDPASYTCVFVGAYTGSRALRTNNAGTRVLANDCGGRGLASFYSVGSKLFANNTNVGYIVVEASAGERFVDNGVALQAAPQKMDRPKMGPPNK